MIPSTPAHRSHLWALATLFAATGALHLLRSDLFTPMMPHWLPAPTALVVLSGVAELLGALGVLVPLTRRAAGWGLLALLVAVFPANVEMLQAARTDGDSALWQLLLWLRLPLQPILGWWVWRAAVRKSSGA